MARIPFGNRHTVFNALAHTLALPPGQWRFLADCHHRRNVALYDGDPIDDDGRISELIAITKELVVKMEALGPPPA